MTKKKKTAVAEQLIEALYDPAGDDAVDLSLAESNPAVPNKPPRFEDSKPQLEAVDLTLDNEPPKPPSHSHTIEPKEANEPKERPRVEKTYSQPRVATPVEKTMVLNSEPTPLRSGAALGIESPLRQSETLRFAQKRISDLELELDKTRRENERLLSASQALRNSSDELMGKLESLEQRRKEENITHEEEKRVFRGQVQAKSRELQAIKGKVEELESRLENNFRKIRVRERELEHRLEISKMENSTILGTKDKMILDLKRQLDQLTHEADVAKNRSQEMHSQMQGKQETMRRVVRALRIALAVMEGDEDKPTDKKED